MRKYNTHFLRNFLIIVLLIEGFVAASVWIINRPETLEHALAVANVRSSWKIEVEKFHWYALENKIAIEGISATNESQGKDVRAKSIDIVFKPLGLIRGKIVVASLVIEDLKLNIPPRLGSVEKKEPRWLDVTKLVLLKNLELKAGRIGNISMSFGRDLSLKSNELDFSLIPSLLGETRFSMDIHRSSLSKLSHEILSAETLNLKTSTELARWHSGFPFVNALQGDINLTNINIEGLAAQSLAAGISFEDSTIKLKNLDLSIEGKSLSGNLSFNTADEKFSLDINIPKPIPLPHIGKKLETMDTAGALSGKVKLSGVGIVPSETTGNGRVELSHRFDVSPDAPVSISTNVLWMNGVVKLVGADARAGENTFSVDGTIDMPRKRFKFDASGKNFPIEHVFEKFTNPHLKKIFGPTDFTGSIEGWGKKFLAKVRGTTHEGGWKPISAERVESELEATYDSIKLKGVIFSGEHKTGDADLKIKLGPKIGDADRTKDIDFVASVDNQPLASSLAALKLSGTGTGSIWIKGPHTAFKGEVKADIESGSWHGIPFDKAFTKIALSRHQIIFSEMAVKLPNMQETAIPGTITGDIAENSLRLRGAPMHGLSVDATYYTSQGKWQIANISWSDPLREHDRISASGSIFPNGTADVKIKGLVDLGAAMNFTPFIKEGQGPLDVDVTIKGADSAVGTLKFRNVGLIPRGMRVAMEDLNGTLRFEGSRIRFDDVTAKMDEGNLKISGYVDQKNFSVISSDLALKGSSIRYRSENGTLNMEIDGDLKVTGTFPNPTLKGSVTILDGKYTKDFVILDALTKNKTDRKTEQKNFTSIFDPHFDLSVRNSGDLAIRNNVGDIWLNINTTVRGTAKKPILAGSIDVVEGEVHYLGGVFDITKGFIEFRQKYAEPYLEVYAQKEINVYNINLVLHGPTDNLALDLSAASPTGSLEKRDVVSLLLFGTTQAERSASTGQAGGAMGASVAGQAISGVVAAPIQKFTHLDVFRLEAGDSSKASISRVYIGKQISDRLTVNFASDINAQDAVQTVIGEYLMTDNLLISGSRSSSTGFKFGGALRFRLR